MRFKYAGMIYWFSPGESKYFKMTEKGCVITEITSEEYYKADAASRL